MYFPLFVGVVRLSLFWYALLCVFSSFAIILKRTRKLIALFLFLMDGFLLSLFYGSWVGLQCVLVVFPDDTHLLFYCTNARRILARVWIIIFKMFILEGFSLHIYGQKLKYLPE